MPLLDNTAHAGVVHVENFIFTATDVRISKTELEWSVLGLDACSITYGEGCLYGAVSRPSKLPP